MEQSLSRAVANKCSGYRDLVGGSTSEYEFLQWLLAQIDNPLLSYELHPVDVLVWVNKYARVSLGNSDYRAVAMPLTMGGSGVGRLTTDINDAEGKVLLTDFPEDMDDAKYIYIKAMRKGAQAVIFRDKQPGVLRRIVVTATEDYTWDRAPPPTTPALVVPRDVGDELVKHVGKDVEFMSDVSTSVSTGYNLVINLEGNSEEKVLLVAHHDHWLSGYADDCLGVGIVMELLFDLLRGKASGKRGLSVISFTAEEAGDPGYASLYWAYGSAKYTAYLEGTGDLDRVYAVLDLDVVGRDYVLHTSEDVMAQLSQVVEAQWEFPKPYFDALNFEVKGIPSITLSSLDNYWDVYHTDRDVESEARQDSIQRSMETARQLLNYLLNNDLNPAPYTSVLARDLESVGININGSGDWETYRLLKYLLSKYLVEYRRDGSVKTVYTNSILSYIRRYLNVGSMDQVPLRVEEMGTGEVLFDTSTIRSNQQLSDYLMRIITSITSELEGKVRT
ncbi:M28 family peptidase [Vulcanisaeta thermophila]|uniref:M28 family peptidase n=1 Tax=Vulcanisaeta thermophila TaxID=867917 RepID=UPI0008530B92|nr:M28 family peptidase [Vulcanisaeta thermophila]